MKKIYTVNLTFSYFIFALIVILTKLNNTLMEENNYSYNKPYNSFCRVKQPLQSQHLVIKMPVNLDFAQPSL